MAGGIQPGQGTKKGGGGRVRKITTVGFGGGTGGTGGKARITAL